MLSTFEQASAWLTPHPKLDGVSLIDHLFNRLNGTYPNKWRANFRDQQAIDDWKEAWAEAFDDEKVTPHDVALGIKNCRRMFDWPPSLTEFLRACRPWSVPEVAHQVAVTGMSERSRGQVGTWPHPAVYWAAVRIGSHDLLNAGYSSLKVRWESILNEELTKSEWAEIPTPTVSLPAPGQDITDNAQARKKIEKISADAFNGSKIDHKAWARRIIDNPKDRSPAVIAMARNALTEAA